MKKAYLALIPLLFIGCASTPDTNSLNNRQTTEIPCSRYNVQAGETIQSPVNCGYLFYGSKFQSTDWDYSLPSSLGNQCLVATLPYTYYFKGERYDIFYEIIITDIKLDPAIKALPQYEEIAQGTVIGTAATDNPRILLRTVTGIDPNLTVDSQQPPVTVGKYTYFDAATLMPSTAKFLTFQPVESRDDLIEFWDYPESLADLAASSLEDNSSSGLNISRFPNFKILIKTQLSEYPKPLHTNSMNDIILRNSFYSFCDTELYIDYDSLPFHLVFYPNFDKYLLDEYTLGDNIYLYLEALYGSNGGLTFYVRDFSLVPPEELYYNKTDYLSEAGLL